MSNCQTCQGLIMEPNVSYGYAGKVCRCNAPLYPSRANPDPATVDDDAFVERVARAIWEERRNQSRVFNGIELEPFDTPWGECKNIAYANNILGEAKAALRSAGYLVNKHPASLSSQEQATTLAPDDAQIASMNKHAAPEDAQDGGGNNTQAELAGALERVKELGEFGTTFSEQLTLWFKQMNAGGNPKNRAALVASWNNFNSLLTSKQSGKE